MKKVIIYSGGMDSFTLLMQEKLAGHTVYALSFNYGQRHSKELEYAKAVCEEEGIEHKIVDVTTINQLLQGSALTTAEIEVPEGHYEEESMKQTVVPNRNMIMLSLAIGWAVSLEADQVCFGAHSGDHAIYPDCRKEFMQQMNTVALGANWHPIEVTAPFIDIDKGDIAVIGRRLGLDYEKSWTCYKGGSVPCGVCGACQERAEAMKKAYS